MASTFSMEKFLRFAVGFRWKDQDASRPRIFSWSENKTTRDSPKGPTTHGINYVRSTNTLHESLLIVDQMAGVDMVGLTV